MDTKVPPRASNDEAPCVFDWKNSATWQQCVVVAMSDLLDTSTIQAVATLDIDDLMCSDSRWLDSAIRLTGKSLKESSFLTLARRLPQCFSFIRAYHACRPVDTASYYRSGLRSLGPEGLRRLAYSVFVGAAPQWFSPSVIDDVIDGMPPYQDYDHVFVALDDRHLVRCCGHYLIHGSEYLMAVAVRLESKTGVNCTQILRQRGTPTIFVCDLPFAMMEEYETQQLAGIILNRWFEQLLHNRPMASELNFTLLSLRKVPSAYIKSHYHPNDIPDPHNGRRIYHWTQADCEGS